MILQFDGYFFQASIVVVGLGLAVAGFAGRQVLRVAPRVAQRMSEVLKTMSSESGILVNYTPLLPFHYIIGGNVMAYVFIGF